MTLISESRLRQIIREAVATASDEQTLLAAGFEDIQRGLAIARRKAAGKQMGFVKDVGDLYAYAAIGGNLEVGPEYAPEMFVVIHDGARPDKKSLGAVFRPNDPPPSKDQFLPEIVDPAADPAGFTAAYVDEMARQLEAAYEGGNAYQFLVKNIRGRVIPATETVAQFVEMPAPAPSLEVPPAAPATSTAAAQVMADAVEAVAKEAGTKPPAPGKKPKFPKIDLSRIFGFFKFGRRPPKAPPAPSTPRAPGSGPERVGRSDKEAGRKEREKAPPGGAERSGRRDRGDLPDVQYSAKAWNEAWSQLNATERAIVLGALTGNRSIQKLREMIAKAIEEGGISDVSIQRLVQAGVPERVPAKGLGVDKAAAARVMYDVKYGRYGRGIPDTGVLADVRNKGLRDSTLNLYPATAALLIAASSEHGTGEITVGNVNLRSAK